MAPKVNKAASAKKQTKKVLAIEDSDAPKGRTESQKNISAQLTYLKKSPLQACKDVLEHYKSLGRFDSEKALLLDKVAKDKKCLFFNDFKSAKSSSSSKMHDSLKGFATV